MPKVRRLKRQYGSEEFLKAERAYILHMFNEDVGEIPEEYYEEVEEEPLTPADKTQPKPE